MKGIVKILTNIMLLMMINSSYIMSKVLVMDFFDNDSFVNELGGKNDTWIGNPYDETIECDAKMKKENRGHSLRLAYDIDSAITYMGAGTNTYIMDYSDYSLIGYASQVPHTASGGFYFLIANTNLTNYRYLVFYARGSEEHGYTRRFKFELKTKDQTSSYVVDGITSKWKRFVIPLSVFDKISDWERITELTIIFNEIVTDKKGVIYFDDFYFTTDPDEIPRMASREEGYKSSKELENFLEEIFMSGEVNLNYRYVPERKNEIFHSEGITLEGQAGRVAGRIVTSYGSQEYGETAYIENTDEYPYRVFHTVNPTISLTTVQLNVERVSPLFNKMTFGNIWIGYSPYIISPYWGWKGISVKGRTGAYEHDTFIIKRPYNSFSLGNRSLYYAGMHRFGIIGLYDSKTAKHTSVSESSASLEGLEKWDIRPVSSEYSYIATSLFRFMNYMVNCEFNYGYYYNKKRAEADYADPQYPVYSHRVSSSAVSDRLYGVKLFVDGFYTGTKLCVSYRDIGEDFKPEYRQEPVLFESVYGDQKGYRIDLKQWYNDINLSLSWDDAKRKSNTIYYKRLLNYGIGYLGVKGMELTLNREINREKYTNTSLEIDKNEEVKSMILVFQYSLIYPLTPGVRYPLTPKVTLREDKITHKATGNKYTTHSLQVDLDYRVETDFGFSISYKTTRYGDSSWESYESPYEDDFLNAYANMRF